jgi:hypothetical protein
VRAEQEAYLSNQYVLLRKKVETPSRVLKAMLSSVPGVDMVRGLFAASSAKNKSSQKSDWLTNVMRFGLPFVLNKTFLKKAGWLKKSLVLLASERAAGEINQDRIGSVVSKVADFIRPQKKKKKKKHNEIAAFEEEEGVVNFGIPPDSETY